LNRIRTHSTLFGDGRRPADPLSLKFWSRARSCHIVGGSIRPAPGFFGPQPSSPLFTISPNKIHCRFLATRLPYAAFKDI
jgi:hypothetical protein